MDREEVPMNQSDVLDGSDVVKRMNERAKEQARRDEEDGHYVPISQRPDDGKPSV